VPTTFNYASFQLEISGRILVGVELDAAIIRAGAQGGIELTGQLDWADPPQGVDALGNPALMTGRISLFKVFPRVGWAFVPSDVP
jgi:hypothetical protein